MLQGHPDVDHTSVAGSVTDVPPPPRWNGAALVGRTPSVSTPLGVGVAALAGCAYVGLVDPGTGAYPLCPFRALTGYDCAGCGMTRSVRALLGGDVVRALDHNVLWTLLVPVLVYGWVVWMAAARGVRLPWPRGIGSRPWLVWPAAVLLLVFWVVRNIGGPDAWLASGA